MAHGAGPEQVTDVVPDCEVGEGGSLKLHMVHDGRDVQETFDAVIGADGSSSCLRPCLFDDTGHEPFTGFACVQGFVLDPTRACPGLHAVMGGGSMMVREGGVVLWAQRYAAAQDDARICFYISVRSDSPDSLRNSIGPGGDAAVRQWAAKQLCTWATPFRELPQAAEWFVLRNLYHHPMRPRLRAEAGSMAMSLCGDALHAMLPFQGAGANVGMQGAGDLATAILTASRATTVSSRHHQLVRGLRTAEGVMLRRSADEAQLSLEAAVYYHSPDGSGLDPRFFGGSVLAVLLRMRAAEVTVGTNWLWPVILAGVGVAAAAALW